MSEYFGTVKVLCLWGQYQYKVVFADPTFTLKWHIKRDFGIPIKEQLLYYKKVNN